MGNGSGLGNKPIYIDIETGRLTLEAIEEAASKASFGYGKSNIFFMPPGISFPGWEQYPQYRGTPWAMQDHLSKREHAVAKVHSFLGKLKVLKNINEEEFKDIRDKSVKRLKRAKWAQYPRNK